jgi:hypothetical protein
MQDKTDSKSEKRNHGAYSDIMTERASVAFLPFFQTHLKTQ